MDLTHRWWKVLWKMKCPNKVKMFTWRFCKNVLPSRKALQNRHLSIDSLCPMCRMEEETSLHILWNCKKVKATWKEVFKDQWSMIKMMLRGCCNNLQVALTLLENISDVELEYIWTTAWTVWNQQNAYVMQNVPPDYAAVSGKASAWLDEWRNVRGPQSTTTPRLRTFWSVPESGVYKINFDGALSSVTRCGGVGAVICNNNGDFMVAMIAKVDGAIDSMYIEAVAVLKALDVALSIGLDRVILEGDALGVIQAISRKDEDFSLLGNITKDIQLKMSSFSYCNVQHVRREANEVANRAVKRALLCNEFTVWMEDPLLFLADVLLQDMNHQ